MINGNYTVDEVTESLKVSERTVKRLADKNSWTIIKYKDGRVYKNLYVPEEIDRYKAENMEVEEVKPKTSQLVVTRDIKEANEIDELPEWNQKVALARLFICSKLSEAYINEEGKKEEIITRFIKEAKERFPYHMGIIKELTLPTLRRWYGVYIKHPNEPLKLASGHGANKGKRKIPEEVQSFIRVIYENKNKPSMMNAYEELVMKYGRIISYGTLKNYIRNDIPKLALLAGRLGNKELKDTLTPYIQRDYSTLVPNQLWVSDGHDLEMSCYHPWKKDSKGNRIIASPKWIVWMDVRTRLITGWTLSWGETAESIAIALKNGISKWGKPQGIYTDNGKAYRGHVLKGKDNGKDEVLQGIYRTIGIEANNIHHAIVRNAQAKHIERMFRDFKDTFSNRSITYKGGNVLEKPEHLKDVLKDKEMKGLILEFNELIEELEEFVEFKNHTYYKIRGGHRGDSMYGKTPLEIFDIELPVENRELIPEEKLRVLFLYEDIRKVGQHGVLFHESSYTDINSEIFSYLGDKVKIKYNPHDLDEMYAYKLTGEFICKLERTSLVGWFDIDSVKTHSSTKKKLREKIKEAQQLKVEVETTSMIEIYRKREQLEIVEKRTPVKPTNKTILVDTGDGVFEEIILEE